MCIRDSCEIGANTSIDRGAIDDPVLGNDVKIDNQVQIGHNCVIGDHTISCGCVGIAGSSTIGRRVMMGGGSGAVSYTHLDVYKRQLSDSARQLASMMLALAPTVVQASVPLWKSIRTRVLAAVPAVPPRMRTL